MLPEAQHGPTSSGEQSAHPCVAVAVATYLRCPVVRVHGRLAMVFGAPVPITAIDENCHLGACEHKVGAVPAVGIERREVNAVAEAGAMH